MNVTRDYNDELDGDYLACKPGNVAEGLTLFCNFGMPIIGVLMLLNGLFYIYLTYIHRRHRKLLARQTRVVSYTPDARQSPRVHPKSDATKVFSYIEKLLLCISALAISTSLQFIVNGFGTMYPTTYIRGQIGDVVGKKKKNRIILV